MFPDVSRLSASHAGKANNIENQYFISILEPSLHRQDPLENYIHRSTKVE
jgi:hypothetical protein